MGHNCHVAVVPYCSKLLCSETILRLNATCFAEDVEEAGPIMMTRCNRLQTVACYFVDVDLSALSMQPGSVQCQAVLFAHKATLLGRKKTNVHLMVLCQVH